MKETKRRWRMHACCEGPNREREASETIAVIERKGFKAKVWAPLLQHRHSGHIHIVVLCNLQDLCELGGIVDCVFRHACLKYPNCPADFKHGDRAKDYSCLQLPHDAHWDQ